MNPLGLHPSSRLVEAEWLMPQLALSARGWPQCIPEGFPVYSRILHPARGINDEPIGSADVAIKSGCTMHRLVQLGYQSPTVFGLAGHLEEPENGNLPSGLLRILCAALAEHTSTPDSCWFCLWEGYGWLHDSSTSTVEFTPEGIFVPSAHALAGDVPARLSPVLRAAVQSAPRVRLPQRNYLLLKGPLESITELGWMFPNGVFVPQSPNLFWPGDHAWCVASEIDLFCTLVAGSHSLAGDLMVDQRLEV